MLIDYFKKVVFDNYANFEGRARREEYWNYVLAYFLLSIASLFVFAPFSFIFDGAGLLGFLILFRYLIFLLLIIPSTAVAVRRLHDIGKSGWILIIVFVPIVGFITLIVLLATEGNYGPNKYGSDPKNPDSNDIFDHLVV
ncbi:MAG TPA: DUF805 domain-containing protein [Saprospiraceae bacterium]|nr:DUF805 domain-containing protein [Saprospiraceae bacterium]HPK08963.1 DUF805 domain-containing protein [Saprospiraceae bacterium]HPQ21471.1 DUF805 domain-containing protein [Saprospiraceae bacterium]HRX28583.1 DUF805 domain-containing protein [Saprospiraceae bacterium]